MTSLCVGIDPGKTGFVALLEPRAPTGRQGIWFEAAPLLEGGSGRTRYDLRAASGIVADVAQWEAECGAFVLVEGQQCMPRNGGMANWESGFGFAMWRMALVAHEVPHDVVKPAQWKRTLGVLGQGKDSKAKRRDSKRRAIEKAQSLFPGVDLRPTDEAEKPSADKAEALLLAYLAQQRCLQGATT